MGWATLRLIGYGYILVLIETKCTRVWLRCCLWIMWNRLRWFYYWRACNFIASYGSLSSDEGIIPSPICWVSFHFFLSFYWGGSLRVGHPLGFKDSLTVKVYNLMEKLGCRRKGCGIERIKTQTQGRGVQDLTFWWNVTGHFSSNTFRAGWFTIVGHPLAFWNRCSCVDIRYRLSTPRPCTILVLQFNANLRWQLPDWMNHLVQL
jgi:hypothetical protein